MCGFIDKSSKALHFHPAMVLGFMSWILCQGLGRGLEFQLAPDYYIYIFMVYLHLVGGK